jgi:hypothetical protein
MAKMKSVRMSLKKALAVFNKQLDKDYEDALPAMLKCVEAQEKGEGAIGIDEDTDNTTITPQAAESTSPPSSSQQRRT